MSIAIISKASYTPRVCLHDVLTRMEEVQVDRITVLLQVQDGSVETFTSTMKISDLAYLSKCLDRRVYNLIEGSAGR